MSSHEHYQHRWMPPANPNGPPPVLPSDSGQPVEPATMPSLADRFTPPVHPNGPPVEPEGAEPVVPLNPAQHGGPASDPTPPPERQAEAGDRSRAGSGLGRTATRSWLARAAGRDLLKTTRHTSRSLRGSRTETYTDTNPLTGEKTEFETEKNGEIKRDPETGQPIRLTRETFPRFPIPPMGKSKHTNLYEPGSRKAEAGPRYDHPMLKDLRRHISSGHPDKVGNFRMAVQASRALDAEMQTAADGYVSMSSGMANMPVKKDNKRDAQARRMYTDLNHTVYDIVMSVPDVMPGQGEQEPEDWEDELNLYNIQELRAHVMSKWQETDTEMTAPRAQLEAGSLITVNPTALAAYLGVDRAALQAQILRGGTPVVPPAVLTKLNFFLNFAEDKTPAGGLPRKLREFHDERPDSTAPMDRVRESDTLVENPDPYRYRNLLKNVTTDWRGIDFPQAPQPQPTQPPRPISPEAPTEPQPPAEAETPLMDAARQAAEQKRRDAAAAMLRMMNAVDNPPKPDDIVDAEVVETTSQPDEIIDLESIVPPKVDLWEEVLTYVSGTDRRDEQGKAFPTMSPASIATFLANKMKLARLYAIREGYRGENLKAVMADRDERSRLDKLALSTVDAHAAAFFARLQAAGIVDENHTRREGFKVLKTSEEIIAERETHRSSKNDKQAK